MVNSIITSDRKFPLPASVIRNTAEQIGVWSLFRKSFEICDFSEAELYFFASDFCEVYVNGEKLTEYSVRSYVYNRAYEVYDVASLLKKGKNTVAVRFCDGAGGVNRGFACEIIVDGKKMGGAWVCHSDDSIENDVGHYIISVGTYEIHNCKKDVIGWKDCDFDDSDWNGATESDVEFSEFYRLSQIKIKAQCGEEYVPECVLTAELCDSLGGKRFSLSSDGETVYFTKLTCSSFDKISMKFASNRIGVYLDGEEWGARDEIEISEGEHVLSIIARGKCVFSLNHGENTKTEEWRKIKIPGEAVKVLYPWNQYIHQYKTPYTTVEIAKNPLPHLENSEICENGITDEWENHQLTRYFSATDGFCDYDISRTSKRYVSDIDLGIDKTGDFEIGQPIRFKKCALDRHLIFDFGIERLGNVCLDFEASDGCRLTFKTYEHISKISGIRDMGPKFLCVVKARDGRQSFESSRLFGFRYVSLFVPGDAEVVLHGISVREKHYSVEDVGGFSCDDDRISAVYEASVKTAELCMMDKYVDCPGCEQNVWVGDAGIIAHTNMVCFGEKEYDKNYLRTIASSMERGLRRFYRGRNPLYQNDTYLPCACFTTYPDGGIPIWSFTWLLQIFDHFLYFGTDGDEKEFISYAEECLRRAEAHMSSRGLFAPRGAWNLIEWANNDLEPYGEVCANNMMLAYCYKKISEYYRSNGENDLADAYACKFESLKSLINKYFWSEERHAYVDMIRDEISYEVHVDFCREKGLPVREYSEFKAAERISVQTATFAVLFDCADGERAEYCKEIIIGDARRGNFKRGTPSKRTYGVPSEEEAPLGIVRTGTPFFLYYILKALFKMGEHELALAVIRRDYGEMIDDGIRTCVETFKDDKGEWGRSMAHGWGSAPAVFLKSEILGVKPLDTGYRKFTVAPHLCGLKFASGSVFTPYGKISVSVTENEGKVLVKCDAPAECQMV